MLADLTLRDFQPCCNNWHTDPEFDAHFTSGSNAGQPLWIIDGATNRPYLNTEESCDRIICISLAVGTPLISLIINVAEGVFKFLKIITFANFWLSAKLVVQKECPPPANVPDKTYLTIFDFFSKDQWTNYHEMTKVKDQLHILCAQPILDINKPYHFKARLYQTGIDFLFIVLIIPSLIGRELSVVYGIISPKNGKKLYSSFERLQGASFMLAPCCQPAAFCHGLGGDIHNSDAL